MLLLHTVSMQCCSHSGGIALLRTAGVLCARLQPQDHHVRPRSMTEHHAAYMRPASNGTWQRRPQRCLLQPLKHSMPAAHQPQSLQPAPPALTMKDW